MSSHHVFPADGRLFPNVAPVYEIPENAPLSREILETWQAQEASYQARLEGVDEAIAQSHEARVRAARALMKDLGAARIGKLAKIEIVNEWVNKSIGYEKNKHRRAQQEGRSSFDWHQTPYETLVSGRGECSDIARLKQYMLQQVGIDPQNIWIVDGGLETKGLEAGKPRSFLAYHEALAVEVEGHKYLLNDNRNMGNKKSGGLEPFEAQLQGDTPNAWGPMQVYTVTQNGRIAYLDKNQAWLETQDPAKVEGAHAPDRHKLSVTAAGAAFDAAPTRTGRVAALARKHLKNALSYNPFRETGGEQPGPREKTESATPADNLQNRSIGQALDVFEAEIRKEGQNAPSPSIKIRPLVPKPHGF